MRKNRLLLILFTLVLPLALTACFHDDDDDDESSCDSPGPGAQPLSGSGSESSPYVISLDIAYGGCAAGDVDPGPIYQITVPAGTYEVTQSNGSTDIELWIYDVNENLLIVIDEKIAGFDESGTFSVDAGTYYIEVFSNSSDSAFTLEVEAQ